MSRALLVLLTAFISASCSNNTVDAEKGTGPETNKSRDESPDEEQSTLLGILDTTKRIEFTIHWHKSDDDSEWRLGPIILDDADELLHVKDAFRESLKTVKANQLPFYQTLLGSFGDIVLVYNKVPDRVRTKELRLATDTECVFYSDERWAARFKDSSFYKALLDVAIRKAAADPKLKLPARPPAPKS